MSKFVNEKLRFAAARLQAGQVVEIGTCMGSCKCGDMEGFVSLIDGRVMVECRGAMDWQNFAGPVGECKVGYGLASTAQAIAATLAGNHPVFPAKWPEDNMVFYSTAGFRGETLKAWERFRKEEKIGE